MEEFEGLKVPIELSASSSPINFGCSRVSCMNMDDLTCKTCVVNKKGTLKRYANREVKDEVIFQVGDRVEGVNDLGISKFGNTYTVDSVGVNGIGSLTFKEIGGAYGSTFFKLLTNKPKTTKEETLSDNDYLNKHEEELCAYCKDTYNCNNSHPDSQCEGRWCAEAIDIHKDNNLNEMEETMSTSININSTVAKVFPNSIEDAKLVTKFFGSEYDETSFRDFMYLRDNAKEVLKEANERQKEEAAKK